MSPSLVRTARAALLAVALSGVAVGAVPAQASGNCFFLPVFDGVATTIAAQGGRLSFTVWTGDTCQEPYCSVGVDANSVATCPMPDEPSTIQIESAEYCQEISYVLAVTGGTSLADDLPLPEDVPDPNNLPEPGVCGPAAVCVGLFPGDVVASFPVVVPGVSGGATHHIVGYVDVYRFGVPGGGTVTVPCPVITVDATVNPCSRRSLTRTWTSP